MLSIHKTTYRVSEFQLTYNCDKIKDTSRDGGRNFKLVGPNLMHCRS